ncbi:MAG: hypothetical protein U0271_11190 [Polyangiaceae bacterium]
MIQGLDETVWLIVGVRVAPLLLIVLLGLVEGARARLTRTPRPDC